jgi:hypothetical protein
VRLNRFKVSENLVINMVWAWTRRTGWLLRHCACHGLVGSLGGVTDGAATRIGGARGSPPAQHPSDGDGRRRLSQIARSAASEAPRSALRQNVESRLTRSRPLAVLSSHLATARARLGELDGACRSATEAAVAAKRLSSERIRSQLAEFRNSIKPHTNSTPVKEFDTKFATFLRATQPN